MEDLKWWNQQTYKEVIDFLDKDNRCAIVQACGSGKSSIIMQLLRDYENEDKIILAPQDTILDKSYESNQGWTGKNVTLLTYSGLLSASKISDFSEFGNIKLIIADELHRTGAAQWGVAFEMLLNAFPNAKVVGATATPRRFDQRGGAEDMVDVHFKGNRAGNWGLAKCIELGILPKPLYIASMYALQEEVNKRLEKLKSNKIDEENKLRIINNLNALKVDWEELHSVKNILIEHLNPSTQLEHGMKILIFCKNIEHIKDVRKSLDDVFISIFSSCSKLELMEFHVKTNNKSFEKFCEKSQPNEVKVLYSIDKFNEGVHVDDLDAVILLRQTKSEIIYLQQIGRVLSIGSSKNPIIFDLVNNFDSLKNYETWESFKKDEGFYGGGIPGGEIKTNYENGSDRVCFYNYILDAQKAFDEIDNLISNSEIYTLEDGFSGSIYAISKKYNISVSRLVKRLAEGEVIDRIVKSLAKENSLCCFGFEGNLDEICKKFKIMKSLVIFRMNRGMSVEEAVSHNRENFIASGF